MKNSVEVTTALMMNLKDFVKELKDLKDCFKRISEFKNRMRNNFEKSVERQLKKAKVKFKYESIRIPYVLCRHYIPDFVINSPLGNIYVECKGYLRPEHKAKMCAVKKQHPELDIRILFYSYRKSYVKWAEKNSFKWAVERIPNEWLNGL